MGKLKVIIKRVGEPCEVTEIENTLEAKQKIVGGYIEVVPFDEDGEILIICNEEGKLMNLDPNMLYGDYDYIAGDFIVAGDDFKNGDFRDLTDEEIEKVRKIIDRRSFISMKEVDEND